MKLILLSVVGALALLVSAAAMAQGPAARLAVADLVYQEQLGSQVQDDGVPHPVGAYNYVSRGELRKFTADIKGRLGGTGLFDLVQPHLSSLGNREQLYDILGRIEHGEFNGADYVLFGTLSSIEARENENPLDKTDTVSHTLNMDLVVEFSLISTRTGKVKAAFTATGSGQDVKLLSARGGRVLLNRARVVADVSRSLGEDVSRQLLDQLAGPEDAAPAPAPGTPAPAAAAPGKVMIFK